MIQSKTMDGAWRHNDDTLTWRTYGFTSWHAPHRKMCPSWFSFQKAGCMNQILTYALVLQQMSHNPSLVQFAQKLYFSYAANKPLLNPLFIAEFMQSAVCSFLSESFVSRQIAICHTYGCIFWVPTPAEQGLGTYQQPKSSAAPTPKCALSLSGHIKYPADPESAGASCPATAFLTVEALR